MDKYDEDLHHEHRGTDEDGQKVDVEDALQVIQSKRHQNGGAVGLEETKRLVNYQAYCQIQQTKLYTQYF